MKLTRYANSGIIGGRDEYAEQGENAVKSTDDTDIFEGSGNVFADLEVENPDEALAKAKLASVIAAIITRRRLTQVQAASMLGVDQPKVSALLRGRLSGFSIDRLLRFLVALDRDVEILVKPKPRTRPRGRVDVVAVSRGRSQRSPTAIS
ncbi:MAG: XRE family transcriptional regulator [Chloroflexi bacterium]|nr:XRE family transcriptional regulator [Chloroflexota bacterium]